MTTKTSPAPPRPAAPAATEPRVGPGLAAAIYFALALLYFLPAFLPGRHLFGTDYSQAGYFFYDFIRERTTNGDLPKWVPYVFGGVPLFSNPGSTYYPVRWVADLLGTRLFFPTLFTVQFGLAGWGMYLLARELGARGWVALVVGLAWQWTGITSSWVYAGHDGRIIVATLAPMVFFFLHRGIRTGRLAPFAGTAASIGLALLSFQIQNAYYLLLAAALWAVFCLLHLGIARQPARMARTTALGLGAVAFAFAMAAVNFLPFQDYVAQSPRGMTGGRGYEFSTSYSMPPRAVVGLAVPEQVGVTVTNDRGEYVFPVYRGENAFRLHTEYVGALVLILATLALVYARRSRYVWFFGGLGAFALSLSLGGNTPLYRLYYEVLPGLNRFRAPDLAYYILAFSLVCIAALGLEAVAAARDEAANARRPGIRAGEPKGDQRPAWVAAGWTGLALLGAVALGGASGGMADGTVGLTPAMGWMRFAIFCGLVAGALWAWTNGRASARVALIALSVVTVADLWLIGRKFFMTVPAPQVMYALDDIGAFLKSQPERGRILPLPGQSNWPTAIDYPMYYDLELVGGEHGNSLQRYNELLGTSPQAMVDYHNLNDRRILAMLNARWLVASAEFQDPMLREVYRGSSAIVYENTAALPRAFLVPEVRRLEASQTLDAVLAPTFDPSRTAVVEAPRDLGLASGAVQGGARITAYAPDTVEVQTQASRAALMVLTDTYYKDWRATVDGRATEIFRANHAFRGVVVPAGTHTVRFTFEPRELYTGFYIHLATLAALFAYGALLLLQRRRGPAADAA